MSDIWHIKQTKPTRSLCIYTSLSITSPCEKKSWNLPQSKLQGIWNSMFSTLLFWPCGVLPSGTGSDLVEKTQRGLSVTPVHRSTCRLWKQAGGCSKLSAILSAGPSNTVIVSKERPAKRAIAYHQDVFCEHCKVNTSSCSSAGVKLYRPAALYRSQ